MKCTDFFNHLGFDIALLERLDRYRERALNQTSHYNPKSNYFKRELQDTFEIITELKKYKFELIIKTDTILQFSVLSNSGKEYTYSFKPLDNICLYLEPKEKAISFYCPNDKRPYALVGFTTEGKSQLLKHNTSNLTLEDFYIQTIDGLEKKLVTNVRKKKMCIQL